MADSVYLRLSTRPLVQPGREMTMELRDEILSGGYWLYPPSSQAEVAIVACGAVLPEAMEALDQLVEDIPGVGLLVVTSPDRLEREWRESLIDGGWSHVNSLLGELPPETGIITVCDAHPATLSWLGAVRRHRVMPLGVHHFGQSADIPNLYAVHGIDADAIVGAAARLISRPA